MSVVPSQTASSWVTFRVFSVTKTTLTEAANRKVLVKSLFIFRVGNAFGAALNGLATPASAEGGLMRRVSFGAYVFI